jgi:hypothetical protein
MTDNLSHMTSLGPADRRQGAAGKVDAAQLRHGLFELTAALYEKVAKAHKVAPDSFC